MACERGGIRLHFSYFPRRLYAHVHRWQVLRISAVVLLPDWYTALLVCREGGAVGIYAPLKKDKTRTTVSSGRHLQPHCVCALLSAGNYQPGIRPSLLSACRSSKNNYAFKFKDLLEKHIRTTQRVQEYADMLRVSRVTLNNSVMAQFGVSAIHLLKQRLLEELKNELLFSDLNVSQLADEFHFSDPSHLMRFFKRETGKTFTQYLMNYKMGIYE